MLGRFWSPAAATLPLWSDSRPEFGSICIFPLQVCTTCSSTIDTLIAIIGIDRIVAIFSLSTVSKLSVLFVSGPDFQWNSNFNGIQYWRLQRYRHNIFNVNCFHSKLPALFVTGPDFQWKSNRLCTTTTMFGGGELWSVELMQCKIFSFEKIISIELGAFWIFRDPGERWVHQVIQICSTVCFDYQSPSIPWKIDELKDISEFVSPPYYVSWRKDVNTDYFSGVQHISMFRITYIGSIEQEFSDCSSKLQQLQDS